jgi:hypothetical protein
LKDLCEGKVLIKKEGKYHLNDSQETMESAKRPIRFSRILHDSKMRTGILFVSLMVLSLMSGYGLAVFLGHTQYSATNRQPVVLGTLTMALNINNVTDLCRWQACIVFNATELSVLDTKPGFVPSYVYAENLFVDAVGGGNAGFDGGRLLVQGAIPDVNGSGRLAIITFARYVETYSKPELVSGWGMLNTMLIDSKASMIPTDSQSLTFSVIETN